MLVLSRHRDESIVIGGNIRVTVVEIRGDKVRLGIEAPKDVTVNRQEVEEKILRLPASDRKVEVFDLRPVEEFDQADKDRYRHARCGVCGNPWDGHPEHCPRHAYRPALAADEGGDGR